LALERRRQRALVRVVPAAHLGRDGEAGRDRHSGVRHLGEAGALAAQQRLHAGIAFRGVVLAEEVDVLRGAQRLLLGGQGPGRRGHASILLTRSRRHSGWAPPPAQRQGTAVAGGWKFFASSWMLSRTSVMSSFMSGWFPTKRSSWYGHWIPSSSR